MIDSLGDSSVIIRVFAWLDQRKHGFLKVKSESIRLIKEAFDQKGIEMPEPTYRLHLREGSIPSADSTEEEKPVISSSPEPVSEADLSADDSIDDQIEAEAMDTSEENLLKTKESGAK